MPKIHYSRFFQYVIAWCFIAFATGVYSYSSNPFPSSNDVNIASIGVFKSTSEGTTTIPDDDNFAPYTKLLSAGQYWLKIDIENNGLYDQQVFLVFHREIKYLKSFQDKISGEKLIQETGIDVSPKNKNYIFKYENIITAESISKQKSTIYCLINFSSQTRIDIKPEIQDIFSTEKRKSIYTYISLIFTSIFLILGAYNLILYFILKERGFLFYALMVLGFALHSSLSLFFNILDIPIGKTLSIIAASTIVAAGSHFSIHFLKVNKHSIWNKLLRVLAIINLIIIVVLSGKILIAGASLAFNKTTSLIAALSSLSLFLLWTGAAINVWKSRDIRGKYFLLINIPILIGALIFTLVWLGSKYQFIQTSFDSSTWVTIIFYSGAAIQLISFSLVFGYHIRGIENEKLEIQTRLNRELEEKVEERTDNLKKANQKISNQKDALTKLNDLKDKLFTIISHDLRSPLNTLQGMLELFNRQSLPEEEARTYIDKINNTLSNTTATMDNLLNWSKSQMTGIQVNKHVFSIDQLIEKNISLIQPIIADKKIKIGKELFAQEVMADEDMMNIVIRNLLSNAVKFTHMKGEIMVKMKSLDNHLEVSVTDNGVGMSQQEIDGLFQISNHHSTVGTLNEKGTGLGLILCKEFIILNGGSIKVESQLRVGTTFIFSLPLQAH